MSGNENPLRGRVYKSKSVGVPVPARDFRNRPKGYKQWHPEVVRLACCSVADNAMTLRRAEAEYGITKSTIHDCILGRVQQEAASGPPRYLTEEEESDIVWDVLVLDMLEPGSRQ